MNVVYLRTMNGYSLMNPYSGLVSGAPGAAASSPVSGSSVSPSSTGVTSSSAVAPPGGLPAALPGPLVAQGVANPAPLVSGSGLAGLPSLAAPLAPSAVVPSAGHPGLLSAASTPKWLPGWSASQLCQLLYRPRFGKPRRPGETKVVKCETCSIVLNSEAQAKQHYSGKNHVKKLKQLGLPIPEGAGEGKAWKDKIGRKRPRKEKDDKDDKDDKAEDGQDAKDDAEDKDDKEKNSDVCDRTDTPCTSKDTAANRVEPCDDANSDEAKSKEDSVQTNNARQTPLQEAKPPAYSPEPSGSSDSCTVDDVKQVAVSATTTPPSQMMTSSAASESLASSSLPLLAPPAGNNGLFVDTTLSAVNSLPVVTSPAYFRPAGGLPTQTYYGGLLGRQGGGVTSLPPAGQSLLGSQSGQAMLGTQPFLAMQTPYATVPTPRAPAQALVAMETVHQTMIARNAPNLTVQQQTMVAMSNMAECKQQSAEASATEDAINKLDPVSKAIYDNMLGKLSKKRKLEIPCSVCDLVFNSEAQASQHFNGFRHEKKRKTT